MKEDTANHLYSWIRYLFLGCVFILCTRVGASQDDKICCDFSPGVKPVWKIALGPADTPEDRCEWYALQNYGTIAYVDSHSIVAGFHFRSCPVTVKGSLGRRHVVDTIFKIDSETGKLLEKREWQ